LLNCLGYVESKEKGENGLGLRPEASFISGVDRLGSATRELAVKTSSEVGLSGPVYGSVVTLREQALDDPHSPKADYMT
jgi:hypothetical protein